MKVAPLESTVTGPFTLKFANRRPRTVVTIGYRLVRPRDAAANGR